MRVTCSNNDSEEWQCGLIHEIQFPAYVSALRLLSASCREVVGHLTNLRNTEKPKILYVLRDLEYVSSAC